MDAIHRAEEYRLKAERLEAELKKAEEDAVEQLRQKDRELKEQKKITKEVQSELDAMLKGT